MSIVDLDEYKKSKQPHATGDAFCIGCETTWIAVVPVGTTQIECPNCKTMRGVMKYPCHYPEGTLVRACTCGCELFHISQTSIMCSRCGLIHEP